MFTTHRHYTTRARNHDQLIWLCDTLRKKNPKFEERSSQGKKNRKAGISWREDTFSSGTAQGFEDPDFLYEVDARGVPQANDGTGPQVLLHDA